MLSKHPKKNWFSFSQTGNMSANHPHTDFSKVRTLPGSSCSLSSASAVPWPTQISARHTGSCCWSIIQTRSTSAPTRSLTRTTRNFKNCRTSTRTTCNNSRYLAPEQSPPRSLLLHAHLHSAALLPSNPRLHLLRNQKRPIHQSADVAACASSQDTPRRLVLLWTPEKRQSVSARSSASKASQPLPHHHHLPRLKRRNQSLAPLNRQRCIWSIASGSQCRRAWRQVTW